jgi:transposase
MPERKPPRPPRATPELRPGEAAHAVGQTLNSFRLGALPVLERIIRRLRLDGFLRDSLPPEDPRQKIATSTGLLLVLKNLLVCREPMYGVGQWASRHPPECFALSAAQLPHWNDDRVGRCLDRLFDADVASLVLAVATHAVREFDVSLDELHNDSTTVTFHGSYAEAAEEARIRGRPTAAITWGHNKDHRPDLKQLLYVLTVTRDGGIPVHFRVESGNTADDRTHRATWDLLCQLTGRRDFLYVADCKLASTENMAYLHQHGGRFLSILPRTRSEDAAFRASVFQGRVVWKLIHEKRDERGEIVDRYSVAEPAALSAEGYRLIWCHSTRKAELDAAARHQQVERALLELSELRLKLSSPRTRYRRRDKVVEAVAAILEARGAVRWITFEVVEKVEETYRQERRGRPNGQTRYVKEERTCVELSYRIDHVSLAAEMCVDGIFPLITNDRSHSDEELLLAYKRQPTIEKRFSQLKTDFEVAPVYLKNVGRIQSILCMYFFALLTEALLERELREAMKRSGVESLPLYPEGRECRRPTARRVIDLFEEMQRHELIGGGESPVVFTTKLSTLQNQILGLLEIPTAYDR